MFKKFISPFPIFSFSFFPILSCILFFTCCYKFFFSSFYSAPLFLLVTALVILCTLIPSFFFQYLQFAAFSIFACVASKAVKMIVVEGVSKAENLLQGIGGGNIFKEERVKLDRYHRLHEQEFRLVETRSCTLKIYIKNNKSIKK